MSARRPAPRRTAASAAPATRHPARALDAFLDRRGGTVVVALMAAYALLFGTLCAIRFRHYLYRDFDLAIFAHATWLLLRGTVYESIGGMSWLGGHVALVLFLIAPLFALVQHPLTLLTVQTVALALGAWPVYRLAQRETGSATAAVACAALYLLHPAVGYANLFEFHPETLATAALLFTIDALRAGRLRATLLWATLAMSTREDVALVVLGLAAVAALTRGSARWRFAASLAALAVVSLIVSFAIVIPTFGAGHTDYAAMYARWGTSIRELLAAAARDPLRALAELVATPGDPGDGALKRLTHLQMLLPLGFLPLAAPGLLVPALPVLLEHFMSSRPSQHSIVFHYTALVTPCVTASAVVGLGRLARALAGGHSEQVASRATAITGVALACALASQVMFGPVASFGILQGIGRPAPLLPDADTRALEPHRDRLLAAVPRDGDVVAGFEFLARLTNRRGLHSLHHFLAGGYTFSNRPYAVPQGVTAVIADLGHGSLFKYVNPGTAERWRTLIAGNLLAPVASVDDLVLFARDPRDTVILWSIAEPAQPRERPVTYDGEIALMGSEAGADRVAAGDVLPLRTYWRRVAPTDRFHLTEIVIVNERSEPVHQLWRYLGYTMHPASEWPEGASVCETYRLLVPPELSPGRYVVGTRLWWRRDGQGICEPDDPAARADQGFVTIARFEVVAPAR